MSDPCRHFAGKPSSRCYQGAEPSNLLKGTSHAVVCAYPGISTPWLSLTHTFSSRIRQGPTLVARSLALATAGPQPISPHRAPLNQNNYLFHGGPKKHQGMCTQHYSGLHDAAAVEMQAPQQTIWRSLVHTLIFAVASSISFLAGPHIMCEPTQQAVATPHINTNTCRRFANGVYTNPSGVEKSSFSVQWHGPLQGQRRSATSKNRSNKMRVIC